MSQIYIPVTAGTLPSSVPTSFPTNSGTAVPIANVLDILGTGGITTSGAGDVVTVTAGGTIPTSFVTNSGTAVPVGQVLDILGAGGITTSAAGNVVTVTGSSSVAGSFVTDDGSTATPVGNVINVVTPGAGTQGISTTAFGNTILITLADKTFTGTATTSDILGQIRVMNVNIPTVTGQAISLRANVVGNDAINGLAVGGELLATFVNFGGVVSGAGNVDSTINVSTALAGCTFTFIISTTFIQLQVTGLATHTIDWKGNIDTVTVA